MLAKATSESTTTKGGSSSPSRQELLNKPFIPHEYALILTKTVTEAQVEAIRDDLSTFNFVVHSKKEPLTVWGLKIIKFA